MQFLINFASDRNLREAVLSYVENFIDQEALKKMKERKDTAHIADAAELIFGAFQQLEIDYGPKQQPKEIPNESR
jgi:hypothetical protein